LRACRVAGDEITFDHFLTGGFSLPHGVSVLPEEGLIAVTNYGTSDIVLSRLAS
jgi:hypothetical protein